MANDRLVPDPVGEPAPPDPSGIEEPHDVLAAEEFAMPVPAPGAQAPADPSGIEEPHDVLAAEEFALPAGDATPPGATARQRGARRRAAPLAAGIVALLVGAYVLRRRR